MNHPTPKAHLLISLIKSAVRITASFSLIGGDLVLSGVIFLVAELLGILEELV